MNGTKLVWWLLGIFATMLISSTSILIARFDRLEDRMRLVEIANAKAWETLAQTDLLSKQTRQEQIDRLARWQNVGERLTGLEFRQTILEGRVNGLTTNGNRP